jgi:hypothetical protein
VCVFVWRVTLAAAMLFRPTGLNDVVLIYLFVCLFVYLCMCSYAALARTLQRRRQRSHGHRRLAVRAHVQPHRVRTSWRQHSRRWQLCVLHLGEDHCRRCISRNEDQVEVVEVWTHGDRQVTLCLYLCVCACVCVCVCVSVCVSLWLYLCLCLCRCLCSCLFMGLCLCLCVCV